MNSNFKILALLLCLISANAMATVYVVKAKHLSTDEENHRVEFEWKGQKKYRSYRLIISSTDTFEKSTPFVFGKLGKFNPNKNFKAVVTLSTRSNKRFFWKIQGLARKRKWGKKEVVESDFAYIDIIQRVKNWDIHAGIDYVNVQYKQVGVVNVDKEQSQARIRGLYSYKHSKRYSSELEGFIDVFTINESPEYYREFRTMGFHYTLLFIEC